MFIHFERLRDGCGAFIWFYLQLVVLLESFGALYAMFAQCVLSCNFLPYSHDYLIAYDITYIQ